jgi:hypothetical protein
VTFMTIHSVIICVVLPWRTYETHPALSLKSERDNLLVGARYVKETGDA